MLSSGKENKHPASASIQAGCRANKNLEAGFWERCFFRFLPCSYQIKYSIDVDWEVIMQLSEEIGFLPTLGSFFSLYIEAS